MPDKLKYGKYDVVGKLGVGGMGVVYKGYDELINRHVAIKTMSLDKSHDENLKKRFYREAQSAGMLNHANIVTIFDMDEEDGQPYIAMELLSGMDLKEIISKRLPLSIDKKIDIAVQACDGLDYAHRHGIVHRDIKPGNIRVLENGLVKILDFGIARIESSELTKTGMVMGTVSYMAPEQIAGKKVDGRADVFSMGVVFYELMTGRKPFPGEAITTIIYKIMNEAPDAAKQQDSTLLPGPVEKIIDRALAKDLANRYATASAMAEDLRAFLATLQIQENTLADIDVGGDTLMAGTVRLAGRSGSPSPASPTVPPRVPLMPSREPESTVARSAPAPPRPAPPTEPARPEPPRPAPPRAAARPVAPVPTFPATPPRQPRPNLSAATLDLGEPPASMAETAAMSPATRVMLIVVAALLILVATLVGTLALRGRRGSGAATTGFVSLDVRPWARVQEVVGADGARVDVGAPVTPCRLALPPGKYEITLANDVLPAQVKVAVEVRAGEAAMVSQVLPEFDVDKLVEAL